MAADAPRSPERDPSAEEVQTIRKLLELPPERIARMRSAMEKIERMSPESRRDFATNLAKYESASLEERRKLMKELREHGGGSSNSGRAVEHFLKTLSPDEAKAERARIGALTPEDRQEFVRSLIEKYGPELAKGKKDGKKEEGKFPKRLAPAGDGPPPAAK